MATIELKSTAFRREREATWRELEDLVARAEKRGVRALDAAEMMRLPVVYRATVSALSVARSISLDRNVLDYLENLCERAYLVVYGPRATFAGLARDFIAARFPAAVRSARWHLAVAALFFALGIAVGWVATLDNEARFYSFVSTDAAQGRDPTSTAEDLRKALFSGDGATTDRLHTYATVLFTHNARIGILAFALGFALGVPTVFLLFSNGLMLGAFAALHQNRGLSVEFWSWILPHGVTELLAIVLCGAAGLVLGGAVIFPGEQSRLQNLARRGRLAGQIVLGCVLLFFVAGLIEGIFRQTVQDVTIRYLVAAGTAVLWLLYFTLAGRGRGAP